jgi:hypothetical protein
VDNEERAPQASAEDNFSDLNVDEVNKNPQDPAAAAQRRHNRRNRHRRRGRHNNQQGGNQRNRQRPYERRDRHRQDRCRQRTPPSDDHPRDLRNLLSRRRDRFLPPSGGDTSELLRAIALIADYSLDNKADGETRRKYKC